jgi:hypothetical protein
MRGWIFANVFLFGCVVLVAAIFLVFVTAASWLPFSQPYLRAAMGVAAVAALVAGYRLLLAIHRFVDARLRARAFER